jgi:hypothetical protein
MRSFSVASHTSDRFSRTGSTDWIAQAGFFRFDGLIRYIATEDVGTAKRALQALTALRALGGLGSWFLPATTVRFFGFEHDPRDDFLNRLSGAREMAFAAGPVISSRAARRPWLQLALACDLLDTLAVAVAVRGGHFTRAQGSGLAAFTVLCAALTALLLAEDELGSGRVP